MMWVVMKHRHRAAGCTSPIVETETFGLFDNAESAKDWAISQYGDDYSCSIHEVQPLPKMDAPQVRISTDTMRAELTGQTPDLSINGRTAKLCRCGDKCEGHFNCRIVWNQGALAELGLVPEADK